MEHPWREKLRRANELIGVFKDECDRYMTEAQVGLVADRNVETGSLRVTLRADAEPPMRLGVIVGDVLHNLRSALDSIAWATANGDAHPPGVAQGIYFPITPTPEKWEKQVNTKLPGVSEVQRQVFRELQPWFYDEEDVAAGDPLAEALVAQQPISRLDRLAKIDRHRIVNPVLARAGLPWMGAPNDLEIKEVDSGTWPCKPGELLFEWCVNPPEAVEELQLGGEPVLVFDEDDADRGKSALRELEGMRNTVQYATRRIEVEVLEVVPPEKWAELVALREAVRKADNAVDAFFEERHTAEPLKRDDHGDANRYSALVAARDAAATRADRLWRELFD